jgi:hypothetical protein
VTGFIDDCVHAGGLAAPSADKSAIFPRKDIKSSKVRGKEERGCKIITELIGQVKKGEGIADDAGNI